MSLSKYFLFISISVLGACQTNSQLALLDREASKLIEASQSRVLGRNDDFRMNKLDGQSDLPTESERLKASDHKKAESPETVNPDANELPARAMTEAEKKAAETIKIKTLDPESNGEKPPADTRLIDLEQSVAIALSFSREYQLRRETLYLSAIEMLREQHLWGPRFFNEMSVNFSGPLNAPSDLATATTLLEELSLRQRLPYGGSISASALVRYVDEIRDNGGPQDTQSAGISLDLEIPLLRGAGTVARESLIQAKRDLVYEVRDFEIFRRNFLVDLSSDYFDLLERQNRIANLKRQLENFQWLLERVNALAQAGREAPFEVQRVKQQVLFAQQSLENADDSYANQLDRYKIRLGLSPRDKVDVKPVDIQIPAVNLRNAKSVEHAHRLRLSLQTARDRVDDAVRGVANAKNNMLFDLDFSASVDLETDSDRNFEGVNFSGEESRITTGIRLERELNNKTEKLAYRSAIIALANRRRAFRELKDGIALDVRRSTRALNQARITAQQQRINVEIAKKRLQSVVLRLRTLGPRDFIEAQEDLIEAEQLRDSAERDIRINVLRYLLNTGQMRVSKDGTWLPPANLVKVEEKKVKVDLIKEALRKRLTRTGASESFDDAKERSNISGKTSAATSKIESAKS